MGTRSRLIRIGMQWLTARRLVGLLGGLLAGLWPSLSQAQAFAPSPGIRVADWRLAMMPSAEAADVCIATRSANGTIHALALVGTGDDWIWYLRKPDAPRWEPGREYRLTFRIEPLATYGVRATAANERTLRTAPLSPLLIDHLARAQRLTVEYGAERLARLALDDPRALVDRMVACHRGARTAAADRDSANAVRGALGSETARASGQAPSRVSGRVLGPETGPGPGRAEGPGSVPTPVVTETFDAESLGAAASVVVEPARPAVASPEQVVMLEGGQAARPQAAIEPVPAPEQTSADPAQGLMLAQRASSAPRVRQTGQPTVAQPVLTEAAAVPAQATPTQAAPQTARTPAARTPAAQTQTAQAKSVQVQSIPLQPVQSESVPTESAPAQSRSSQSIQTPSIQTPSAQPAADAVLPMPAIAAARPAPVLPAASSAELDLGPAAALAPEAAGQPARIADERPATQARSTPAPTLAKSQADGITPTNQRIKALIQRSRHAEALALAEATWQRARQSLGADHPQTVQGLTNLAFLYYSDGRFAKAAPLYAQAVDLYKQALGPDHPNVGVLLSYLASAYKNLGRYDEAEPLYQESLALAETTYGPDHSETAMSLNSLALLYDLQGRYAEAETLFERALRVAEKALGPKHTAVVTILDNLAGLYSSWGRYADAETLSKEVMTIREARLGAGHPKAALAALNLAKVYRDQGRLDRAEALFDQSLPALKSRLGSDHPEVLKAMTNLASLYGLQGRYTEAEAVLETTLERLIAALGADHPDVATAFNNLALLHRMQGNTEQALRFHRRALASHLQRLERELPAEQADGLTGARAHALAYLQVLARLQRPNPQQRADMLAAVQLANARGRGESLAGLAERLATTHRQALLAVLRKRPALARPSRQSAAGQGGAETHRDTGAALEALLDALEQQTQATRERLQQAFVDASAPAVGPIADLASVQQALQPGEAALTWVLGPDESYLLLVTRPQPPRADLQPEQQSSNAVAVELKPLPVSRQQIADQLQRLESGLGATFPAAVANEVFAQLFGADWQADLNGIDRLLLIPPGPLAALGFPILLTEPPAPEQSDIAPERAEFDRAPWLVRRFGLRVLPALSAIPALSRQRASIPATMKP